MTPFALARNSVIYRALLEAGCGSGRLLAVAAQPDRHAVARECATALACAQAEMDSLDGCESWEEGLWPAGSFDGIVLMDALDNYAHSSHLLRLCAHYSRIDGVLLISLENGRSGEMPAAVRHQLARYGFRPERLLQWRFPSSIDPPLLRITPAPAYDGIQPAPLTRTRLPRPDHTTTWWQTIIARYIP